MDTQTTTKEVQYNELYSAASDLVSVIEKYIICKDTRNNLILATNKLKKLL